MAEPDDTWSDWSVEQSDPASGRKVLAPTARFLQYRVTLTSESPKTSPELRSMRCVTRRPIRRRKSAALDVPNLDTDDAR